MSVVIVWIHLKVLQKNPIIIRSLQALIHIIEKEIARLPSSPYIAAEITHVLLHHM